MTKRDQVVAEARSWIGTPYHRTGQGLKGAGCNCATLIYQVLLACGLMPEEDMGIFGSDWWANTDEETYMRRLIRHAPKVAEGISYATLDAKPGNIVLTKHAATSRVFNHGGIVTNWPWLVHSVDPKVKEVNATKDLMWSFREVFIFDPFKGE